MFFCDKERSGSMGILNDAVSEFEVKKLRKYMVETKCPDIVVGIDGEFWFESSIRSKNNDKLEIKEVDVEITIVIVLESPHKKEFKNTNPKENLFTEKILANPAMGKTGEKLQTCFTKEKLNNLLSDDYLNGKKYRVILMNSIQYQCSLGMNTKIIRDNIFLKLWYRYGCMEDFCNRLKFYNPNVIINLCTEGGHDKEINLLRGTKYVLNEKYIKNCVGDDFTPPKEKTLRGIVQNSIRKVAKEIKLETNKEVLLFEGNHPSYRFWQFQDIRSIENSI